MNCACGAPTYARGKCKRCYSREYQRVRRQEPEVRAQDSAITRRYREEHPDRVREGKRRYREAHAGKVSEYRVAYYARNKARALDAVRAWAKRNPAKVQASKKREKKKHAERYRLWGRDYRAKNLSRLHENEQRYRDSNREAYRVRMAAMKGSRRSRRIAWADVAKIQKIYAEARRRTRAEGVAYEVDHEIPLHGKTVSGLHVETNLRIVLREINRAKQNIHVTI